MDPAQRNKQGAEAGLAHGRGWLRSSAGSRWGGPFGGGIRDARGVAGRTQGGHEPPAAPNREIVTLYHWRGLTMREIGARYGINESRVSQIHKRALGIMAGALREQGITGSRQFFRREGAEWARWRNDLQVGHSPGDRSVHVAARGGGQSPSDRPSRVVRCVGLGWRS